MTFSISISISTSISISISVISIPESVLVGMGQLSESSGS